MADEDMPPPLEDMSGTLEQARKLKALRLGSQGQSTNSASSTGSRTQTLNSAQTPGHLHSVSVDKASGQKKSSKPAASATQNITQSSTQNTAQSSTTTPDPQKADRKSKSESSNKAGAAVFGGMKKGFLFGGSKSSSVSSSQKTKADSPKTKTDGAESGVNGQTDSIPFIKPRQEDKDSGLKLDEVQKAMESTKGFLQDKDWVTEDLLEKVQKNETLAKRLGDPRFMQAVTEFQANPKAAMEKYQSSPEMQQFLKEFCGILGEHFTSMGDQQESQAPSQAQKPAPMPKGPKITELTDQDTSASNRSQGASVPVDPHVQQILSDPANQEILMDPKIQMLIESLRNNPEKAQRMLHEGDRSFRQKVDRLISLGLLKFQG